MVRMARLEYEEQAHTNDDYSNPPPLLYLHLREIQALRRGYKGECTFYSSAAWTRHTAISYRRTENTPGSKSDTFNGATRRKASLCLAARDTSLCFDGLSVPFSS